jgi:histidinol-phosphate aminotransferase
MITTLLRPHLRALTPYSTARDEFTGSARVYLDANENPFGHEALNRYPDPHSRALKDRISQLKSIPAERIFIGNGSDEAIDLLIRAFVNPGEGVVITPPTYGMYRVATHVNAGRVIEAPLFPDFSLNHEAISRATTEGGKLLFLCSPNNPTGNQFSLEDIQRVLEYFQGVVVVDEAYIDFASGPSACELLKDSPRLVVLQTLSKAWGMAAIRVGLAFGHPELIQALSRIKLPYNVNQLSQTAALARLAQDEAFDAQVKTILAERARVSAALTTYSCIQAVFPSEANFLLVKCVNAQGLFDSLKARGIIVRDRSRELHCDGCIRITIGTKEENDELLLAVKDFV